MNLFAKILNALGKEPVAVQTAAIAAFELVAAIRANHVTDGIIGAAVLAVVGLFTRAQVSPTADDSDV